MEDSAHIDSATISSNGGNDFDEDQEYEVIEIDAQDMPKPRILFMGPQRSGKTSIKEVVFYKKSPHETNYLEPTHDLDIKVLAYNPFAQFQIWDFPGDHDISTHRLIYDGAVVTEAHMFDRPAAVIFIVDAQDDPVEDALPPLLDTLRWAHAINPNLDFEIFIHKVDGDLFLSDEQKVDCQRDVQDFIADALSQYDLDVKISYYLTSIYDHSIFDAISKVVQKLIPQLPTLENLLNCLNSNSSIEKSFLFDVVSRIYLATDLSPVDMSSYELCCDMIDVVVDVSCIYGVESSQESDGYSYDEESGSTIRLSNGMVLYLREVGPYLALVCLIRAENFNQKEVLIDYNITCFKKTLAEVFNRPPIKKLKERTSATRQEQQQHQEQLENGMEA